MSPILTTDFFYGQSKEGCAMCIVQIDEKKRLECLIFLLDVVKQNFIYPKL